MVDPLSGKRDLAEAEALLLLQRLPGLADRGITRLIGCFGTGRAALEAPARAFADALGRGAGVGARARARELAAARGSPTDRAAVSAALAGAEAVGARVVTVGTASYPARLRELPDPPPVLFLRGRAALLDRPAVAVVGSRRATGYGRRTAGRLAQALARRGVVVVSGFALGIDGEAHRAALAAGGGTVAVLGTGPDVVHPRAHARLMREVLREGLSVTEFPPGATAHPHHFPRRNRVMAALAHAVVVVEAAQRSGALITARHALDLGRDVLAVPGPIDAPNSAGTNALIRDGAHPALGADEILATLGVLSPAVASSEPPDGDASAVWRALGTAPVGVDEVAVRSGLAPRRALAALSLLELDGWAVQHVGARFARRE